MAQHFLLSAKARTLSLGSIMRMSDEQAHARFQEIRFADNGGAAFCPRCQCTAVYTYAARRIWKGKACEYQFSVTSGTIFASRKLPMVGCLTLEQYRFKLRQHSDKIARQNKELARDRTAIPTQPIRSRSSALHRVASVLWHRDIIRWLTGDRKWTLPGAAGGRRGAMRRRIAPYGLLPPSSRLRFIQSLSPFGPATKPSSDIDIFRRSRLMIFLLRRSICALSVSLFDRASLACIRAANESPRKRLLLAEFFGH